MMKTQDNISQCKKVYKLQHQELPLTDNLKKKNARGSIV